jgi:hypothetical protein
VTSTLTALSTTPEDFAERVRQLEAREHECKRQEGLMRVQQV